MQYTIRTIPENLDNRLREVASAEGTSLNAAALSALSRGLGAGGAPFKYRELGSLINRPEEIDRAAWEATLRDLDTVDPEAWR